MQNWLRLLVEYVGNIDFHLDRRRDQKARILMEHIKEEMSRQGLMEQEKERRVGELREAVRAAEAERAR